MTPKPRSFTTHRWPTSPLFILLVALTLIGGSPVGAAVRSASLNGSAIHAPVAPQVPVCSLVLVKTASSSSSGEAFAPGNWLTYTINWQLNFEQSQCTVGNLVIADTLPEGTRFVSAAINGQSSDKIVVTTNDDDDGVVDPITTIEFRLGPQGTMGGNGVVSFTIEIGMFDCAADTTTNTDTITNTAFGYNASVEATPEREQVVSNTVETPVACDTPYRLYLPIFLNNSSM